MQQYPHPVGLEDQEHVIEYKSPRACESIESRTETLQLFLTYLLPAAYPGAPKECVLVVFIGAIPFITGMLLRLSLLMRLLSEEGVTCEERKQETPRLAIFAFFASEKLSSMTAICIFSFLKFLLAW